MKTNTLIFLPALLVLVLGACDDATVQENSKDYFPMADQASWSYVEEYSCYCRDSTYSPAYYYDLRVMGDTLIAGKVYKKLANHNNDILRLARKEGNQYWEWDFTDEEYMILDTDVPQNGSWIRYLYGGVHTIEYTVQATHGEINIKGRVYKNIFVVLQKHTYDVGTSTPATSYAYHYYARGIGEIMIRRPHDEPYRPKSKVLLLPVRTWK